MEDEGYRKVDLTQEVDDGTIRQTAQLTDLAFGMFCRRMCCYATVMNTRLMLLYFYISPSLIYFCLSCESVKHFNNSFYL